MFGLYYQAKANKNKTWFIIGILKSEDNLAFVRTLNKKEGLLEFFIPPEQEKQFLKIMKYLRRQNLITELTKKPNRLLEEEVFPTTI